MFQENQQNSTSSNVLEVDEWELMFQSQEYTIEMIIGTWPPASLGVPSSPPKFVAGPPLGTEFYASSVRARIE